MSLTPKLKRAVSKSNIPTLLSKSAKIFENHALNRRSIISEIFHILESNIFFSSVLKSIDKFHISSEIVVKIGQLLNNSVVPSGKMSRGPLCCKISRQTLDLRKLQVWPGSLKGVGKTSISGNSGHTYLENNLHLMNAKVSTTSSTLPVISKRFNPFSWYPWVPEVNSGFFGVRGIKSLETHTEQTAKKFLNNKVNKREKKILFIFFLEKMSFSNFETGFSAGVFFQGILHLITLQFSWNLLWKNAIWREFVMKKKLI